MNCLSKAMMTIAIVPSCMDSLLHKFCFETMEPADGVICNDIQFSFGNLKGKQTIEPV